MSEGELFGKLNNFGTGTVVGVGRLPLPGSKAGLVHVESKPARAFRFSYGRRTQDFRSNQLRVSYHGLLDEHGKRLQTRRDPEAPDIWLNVVYSGSFSLSGDRVCTRQLFVITIKSWMVERRSAHRGFRVRESMFSLSVGALLYLMQCKQRFCSYGVFSRYAQQWIYAPPLKHLSIWLPYAYNVETFHSCD